MKDFLWGLIEPFYNAVFMNQGYLAYAEGLKNTLLISLMAGAVTGCSAVREKNIVFNSAQEEPPQTNLTFFGFKYEAL